MISKCGNHDKYCYFCCEDTSLIENYDKAVADTTNKWVIHHRLETHFPDGTERPTNAHLSINELKAQDMYYNRPAKELIFMTRSDHQALHNKKLIGHKHTEEAKQKMREASLNMSAETRKKMSEALKGRKLSEEHKRHISESQMGRPGTWAGRHHTEEQKRKASESMKRYWQKKREEQQ